MDGMSDIYVLQGDGMTVNLTHDPDVRIDVQPHWSPDGSQILFTRYLKNGSASVMRVNADGQKLVDLTPNFARSVRTSTPTGRPTALRSSSRATRTATSTCTR